MPENLQANNPMFWKVEAVILQHSCHHMPAMDCSTPKLPGFFQPWSSVILCLRPCKQVILCLKGGRSNPTTLLSPHAFHGLQHTQTPMLFFNLGVHSACHMTNDAASLCMHPVGQPLSHMWSPAASKFPYWIHHRNSRQAWG